MKNRHRVVWTKGMFLTPQHFQTQDQFFEDALQFRFAASHFANWGVTELDIDSEALGNGLFRLNQVQRASCPMASRSTCRIPTRCRASRGGRRAFSADPRFARCLPRDPREAAARAQRHHPGTGAGGVDRRARPPRAIWPKRACSPTRTRATRRSPCRSRAEPFACSSRTSTATASRPCASRR